MEIQKIENNEQGRYIFLQLYKYMLVLTGRKSSQYICMKNIVGAYVSLTQFPIKNNSCFVLPTNIRVSEENEQ